MGCFCNINRQIDADVNLKNNHIIKANLNLNKHMIHNQKDKDDIIIETKIPEKELDPENLIRLNPMDIEDNDYLTKNQFNQRAFELINLIRQNPPAFSQVVLDNINNIITETHKVKNKETGIEENKPLLFFKKKVKVNLFKGEQSFIDAANILKKTAPMNKLKFNKNIVIPLPDNKLDIMDSNFITSKVNEIRNHSNINIYFKEYIKNPEIAVLMMIVDDVENMSGKKRDCILNPNLKYIGIDSKFIGETFIAHFSFSK